MIDVPRGRGRRSKYRETAYLMRKNDTVEYGNFTEAKKLSQALLGIGRKVRVRLQENGNWKVWRID